MGKCSSVSKIENTRVQSPWWQWRSWWTTPKIPGIPLDWLTLKSTPMFSFWLRHHCIYDITPEKRHFSNWFPNTCPKLVCSAAGGGKKTQPGRVVWCLCWMGEFSLQAEQTFRPPVQSDCFIVTSCWVWSIYTHLWLVSHSAVDMIFTSTSGKIISWLQPVLFFYLQFSEVYSSAVCCCCLDHPLSLFVLTMGLKWAFIAEWGSLLSQSAICTL